MKRCEGTMKSKLNLLAVLVMLVSISVLFPAAGAACMGTISFSSEPAYAQIYIDGVLSGSLGMKATSINNDSHPLRFGCWEQCDKDKHSLKAESILDDVRIYSRALTGYEVKTLQSWKR